MRNDNVLNTISSGNYSNQPVLGGEIGGSQVLEPEIIGNSYIQPINPLSESNNISLQDIVDISSEQVIPAQDTMVVTSSPNANSEPSATTDETKTYVEGGTTANSSIVINKPKRNYLMYGIIGLIGALVVYKMFFNKKSE